jgi:50S ribosomal protein L16 3-hydroxylase
MYKIGAETTQTRFAATTAATSFNDDDMSVIVDEVEGPFHASLLLGYWGHKPLLIRNAFDASTLVSQGIWPSWNDIVKLACPEQQQGDDDDDDDMLFHSGDSARMIQHTPGKLDSFTLDVGPFEKDCMDSVIHRDDFDDDDEAPTKWTLLVNDVDRYIPSLSHWIEDEFGFLPRWRRDDAQVSIAHTGGGIGPHVDNYDVFLAQGSGQRSWQVGSSCKTPNCHHCTAIKDRPLHPRFEVIPNSL